VQGRAAVKEDTGGRTAATLENKAAQADDIARRSIDLHEVRLARRAGPVDFQQARLACAIVGDVDGKGDCERAIVPRIDDADLAAGSGLREGSIEGSAGIFRIMAIIDIAAAV
jgi:hypothetical protein